MRKTLFFLTILSILACTESSAQFSRQDSLRGTLSYLRSSYDVTFYDLEVKIDPIMRRIGGRNIIRFRVDKPFQILQLDLFENMKVHRVEYRGKAIKHWRDGNTLYTEFPYELREGDEEEVTVLYGGRPTEAKNPPWDGGFKWGKDPKGYFWLSVTCEGMGASSWWPLKDHLSDEPDSMRISYIVPEDMFAVSNGNLKHIYKLPGEFRKYEWYVSYPINSYNVTFYIGQYKHFKEFFENENGGYKLDFYALRYHEDEAKAHFLEAVPEMLKCFENYFGEYPFPKDGYALVETNYWGMEHQGAIAYGNEFKNNEYGFDFIIIHETAHEWFGNSISVSDHAEMWIHEAFATYAEMIFVEWRDGEEKAQQYLNGQRKRIVNQVPMLGPLGVNYDAWPSADIYYKGSWMLHSLRNTVQDDKKWFATIRSFCEDYKHSIVNSQDVITYFNRKLGEDYSYHFNQYLKHAKLPQLHYKLEQTWNGVVLSYKWEAGESDFRMPVDVAVRAKNLRLYPTNDWQQSKLYFTTVDGIEFKTDLFLYDLIAESE